MIGNDFLLRNTVSEVNVKSPTAIKSHENRLTVFSTMFGVGVGSGVGVAVGIVVVLLLAMVK